MPRDPGRSAAPVVVKLGGSLITRKREQEKLRPKILARLAREVAGARGAVPVVLLHGAGSFGHPSARRFRLAEPPQPGADPSDRARGAAIVAAEVRRLHLAVLRELVRAGASPWSIPPPGVARNKEGGLVGLAGAPFEEALRQGMLPVSFGDVVPDESWGFSILSADTIAAALVPLLKPSRVVFATDVPGILETARPGRRPIVPEVTSALLGRLAPDPSAPDVTGGIRAKAAAMRTIALAGADAALISGLPDGNVSRAIRGEAVYGSWAHAAAA
jgi:isopentenyl phosphate kinase